MATSITQLSSSGLSLRIVCLEQGQEPQHQLIACYMQGAADGISRLHKWSCPAQKGQNLLCILCPGQTYLYSPTRSCATPSPSHVVAQRPPTATAAASAHCGAAASELPCTAHCWLLQLSRHELYTSAAMAASPLAMKQVPRRRYTRGGHASGAFCIARL
jgi:hypothetical protein